MTARTIAPVIASQTTDSTATGAGALRRAAILAGALGLVLLWGVGFAAPDYIHNAAHDSRHSLAFPCH
jgi:cobalt transporter subunit CbtB